MAPSPSPGGGGDPPADDDEATLAAPATAPATASDDDDDDSPSPTAPQVLARLDGRPLIASWTIGRSGGRLVVMATAAPLLDAAQVDPQARALLAALTADIARHHPSGQSAWVRALEVPDDDDSPPPNILWKLLGTPPFSYAVWQFLALGLVWLGYRAFWLGRVSAPGDHRHERFGRHVSALAWHLRRAGARDDCAAAIARHLGRAAPTPAPDDEAARAAVAALYPPPQPEHPDRDELPHHPEQP
jgi:hypothetical protein